MTGDMNCKHTPHIVCREKDHCHTCGWNPDIEAMRKERIALGLPAIPPTEKEDA